MSENPITGHFRKDVVRRRDAKGCGFCAFQARIWSAQQMILPTQVTADNDIALVQLAEPVSLTPIRVNSNPCLTPPDVTGIPVSLLGWGATNDTESSEQSPTLSLGLMQTFNTTLVWFFNRLVCCKCYCGTACSSHLTVPGGAAKHRRQCQGLPTGDLFPGHQSSNR
jgi:hypothetical protein